MYSWRGAVATVRDHAPICADGQYADLRDGLVRGQRAHGVNTAERMDLAARSRGHEEGIELKPKPSNPLLGQSLNARLVSIHPGFRGGIAPR